MVAVAAGLHPGGNGLANALVQTNDGFVASGFAPAKQAHQCRIWASDIGMLKAGRTTPNANHHLRDE